MVVGWGLEMLLYSNLWLLFYMYFFYLQTLYLLLPSRPFS